jgi:hypothetical protein
MYCRSKVQQISFKWREYPVLMSQQKNLMEYYGMDMSGLYKHLLREKHSQLFSPSGAS